MSQWLEVANLTDFITQNGSGSSAVDIKITDLYRYLRNPYSFLPQIRNASRYLNMKYGVFKDTLRMIQSLPTLKYSLSWTNFSDKPRESQHEKLVFDFLKSINVTKLLRNGLYEVAELGTVVTCLRSNKYVQFLELDDLVIETKRNDKWVVKYDLKKLDSIKDHQTRLNTINSLPPEVSVAKYSQYKKTKDEKSRYVELSNCDVISIDSNRNSPFGFPFTMGAWLAILQKEIIDRVERSISNKLIKEILILYAGHIDKEQTKPVPKEILSSYFREVSKLIEKKDGTVHKSNESAGSGVIALPHFLKLEALKVDTSLFKEELYNKINDDIFMGLGVSPALIFGGGGNYASANINSEKLFSFITTIIEQFEYAINGYLAKLLPDHLSCEIKFDRSTVLDKQTEINNRKEIYLQTGLITPWLESVMNMPISDIISQREREIDLGIPDLFSPPKNAYTSSSNDDEPINGSPSNESTEKTLTDDGNNTPSPSDYK